MPTPTCIHGHDPRHSTRVQKVRAQDHCGHNARHRQEATQPVAKTVKATRPAAKTTCSAAKAANNVSGNSPFLCVHHHHYLPRQRSGYNSYPQPRDNTANNTTQSPATHFSQASAAAATCLGNAMVMTRIHVHKATGPAPPTTCTPPQRPLTHLSRASAAIATSIKLKIECSS